MTPTDYIRPLIATAALLTALVVASPAQAAQTPDQILSNLAARQTHSWIDNNTTIAAQLAWYKAGGHLDVTCGYVSEIARQLLVEQGYIARRVETITTEPSDGLSDGHAMVEVFYQGHWQLYDVDANAKAVDASGSPVQLTQQVAAVKAGTARWQSIASDPLFREDEPNVTYRDLARRIFADPEAFYRRVMGFALFPTDGPGVGLKMYYNDATQTARLNTLWADHYVLASPTIWFNLNASLASAASTTAARTVAPAPAPSPSPTVAPTVATTDAQAKRPCQRKWRRYQRVHYRRALIRYKKCVRNKAR